MPLYRWHGINADGTACHGSQEASDQASLKTALLAQGTALLSARETSPVVRYLQLLVHSKPSGYECHLFFAHLSSFLQAGISLKQALHILQGVQHNARLKTDIRAMVIALEQGQPLHVIVKTYAYFPAYAHPLIQTSEQTGSLIAALDTISAMTVADYEYQKTVRTACTGPVITITVAIMILCITVTVLMPQFVQLYKQCNVTPPSIILLGSTVAAFFTPLVLTLSLCLLTGTLIILNLLRKKISLMSLASRLPLLRNTILNADMLRWLTIMHAYTSNGLSIVDACTAMAQSTDSHTTQKLIRASISSLQAGKKLSDGFAMLQHNRTIAFVGPLLSIGEETGDLTTMLSQAKHELATIIQQQTSLFTKLIGPILTIATGLLIGGLLVMLYLPIMQLGSLIKF
jgi:type IV pilus assembly protein PilC